MLFELTKIPTGCVPTVFLSANVVAFGFQVADGQNFGWLYERAKMKNNKYKTEFQT